MRLTYYVPARDEESERVVDPHGVVSHHGVAYLDAWCHSAEAPRLFRLDRIHEADGARHRGRRPSPSEPRDLSDGVFAAARRRPWSRCALQPEARWVEEYYAVEEVRPAARRRLEVDLLVGDERWLQRLLLRLAPYAAVVAPAHFGDGAAEAIRRALALYDHPAG